MGFTAVIFWRNPGEGGENNSKGTEAQVPLEDNWENNALFALDMGNMNIFWGDIEVETNK